MNTVMDPRLQLIERIKEWNSNRLDLFEISLPNEGLEFHGVLRFFFQGDDQKFQTKCLRVSSTANVGDLLPVLNEKFHPDMKMLSMDQHSLYEHHVNGERKLEANEKPLLIQLNWGKDDREGKFILKNETRKTVENSNNVAQQQQEQPFKRRWGSSKRKKKQKEIISSQQAEKSAKVPDSSFTRTISNPEEVMKRKRQQKLGQKLQQIHRQDGTAETGGPLKIYGDTLNRDVPYKTLLLTVNDPASEVVRETLEKYSMESANPNDYCLMKIVVPPRGERGARIEQAEESVLGDHECPLSIMLYNPPQRGTLMFQIRARVNAPQPPPGSTNTPAGSTQVNGNLRSQMAPPNAAGVPGQQGASSLLELPYLIELNPDGSDRRNGRMYRLPINRSVNKELKLGSGLDPTLSPQNINIQHPEVRPLHCIVNQQPNGLTIRPGDWDTPLWVNNTRVNNASVLQSGVIIKLTQNLLFRFIDPQAEQRYMQNQQQKPPQTMQQPQRPVYPQQQSQLQQRAPTQGAPPLPPHSQQLPPAKPPMQNDLLPLTLEYTSEVERKLVEQIVSYTPRVTDQYRFKLAPAYTLYLMLRSCHREIEYASERHTRLTQLANQMSGRIFQLVQSERQMMPVLAFWMANASELLHFMKHDQELNSHTYDSQEILADAVQHAFNGLLMGFQEDVSAVRTAFISLSDEDTNEDQRQDDMPLQAPPSSQHAPTVRMILQTMSTAMTLLRRCRVNAALTIQLFSQLFHFINAWIFNLLVLEPQRRMLSLEWGQRLGRRLNRVKSWAERQGLELAADCHLQRVTQACQLLATDKSDVENLYNVSMDLMRLNSIQLRKILESYLPGPKEPIIPQEWIDFVVSGAVQVADKVFEEENVPIRLEEEDNLDLPLLVPDDGYSCDIPVEGIPPGLPEYIDSLARQGLIRRSIQNSKVTGLWTVYMYPYENTQAEFLQDSETPSLSSEKRLGEDPPTSAPTSQPSGVEERVYRIQKVNNSLGLSIVAAKIMSKAKYGIHETGEFQEQYGIYVKAVVPGGGAYQEGSLEPGDQLLEVEGMSLIGLVQEDAAKVMQKTGQVVTLRVGKRAAQYHGIIHLITQPSPVLAARQQHIIPQQAHEQQQQQQQQHQQQQQQQQQQQDRMRQQQIDRERQQQMERERLERERQQQMERERLERERQQQMERERLERERQQQMERERQQQMERERLERERQQQMERERLERERQQQMERERLERERQQQMERERLERERQQQMERERQQQMERERLERERQQQMERERQQQMERERLERERQQQMEREHLERERQQQMERERQQQMERGRLERERQQQMERERLERERQQQIERERQQQMEQERQRMEQERRQQDEFERLQRQKDLEKQRQMLQLQQLQQKQQMQNNPVSSSSQPPGQTDIRPISSAGQQPYQPTIPRGQPYPAMPMGSSDRRLGPNIQFRAAKSPASSSSNSQPSVRVLNRLGAGARPSSAATDNVNVRTLPASHRTGPARSQGDVRGSDSSGSLRMGSPSCAAKSQPDLRESGKSGTIGGPGLSVSRPSLMSHGSGEQLPTTHREPFWSETDLDSGGVIKHERNINKRTSIGPGQAPSQQTQPPQQAQRRNDHHHFWRGVSHAISQPQLARRQYMETDVDRPPVTLSSSVSQPDIHISGRSSEVRVMPPREVGDLPAAVIDHRPNQQHFYDKTGPLPEPYLPPFSRMDTSFTGSSASAPVQPYYSRTPRHAPSHDSLARVDMDPLADRYRPHSSEYELATGYPSSPTFPPPPPPADLMSSVNDELPPPPATNEPPISSSSSSGNYQQLCHTTSRLPPDDSQATTASSLASNAPVTAVGYDKQRPPWIPSNVLPRSTENYTTLSSTVTSVHPSNASERAANLKNRIRDLESRQSRLTPEQKNELESLRVQLAFDNCASDRRRRHSGSSSEEETESADINPSESRARIAQIQMVREQLDKKHKQRIAQDELERAERAKQEKESQQQYQRRLEDFEQRRDSERAKQRERTEQRAREQEDWLRNQQALREQQRSILGDRESEFKPPQRPYSGGSMRPGYARFNNSQSTLDLPSSATVPSFSSTLAQSKKTVSFSTDNLETIYRRNASGEEGNSAYEDSLNSPDQGEVIRSGPPMPPPKPRPNYFANRPTSTTHGEVEEEKYQLPANVASRFSSSEESPNYVNSPIGGVIGSQEVYRDHYQIRTAQNKQAALTKRQMESKAESLSFSEKMRMFAQRSGGETNTPANKIKASSAQRLLEQR